MKTLFILLSIASVANPQAYKAIFQEHNIENIEQYKITPNDSLFRAWVKQFDLYSCNDKPVQPTGIYSLDINNDGLKDFLFYNTFCTEDAKTKVFVGHGATFLNCGTISGTLECTAHDSSSKCLSLILASSSCCAATYTNIYYYSLEGGNDNFKYRLLKSIKMHLETIEPTSNIIKPTKFRVLNDSYKLRFSPTNNPPKNNIIAELPSGGLGIAYAASTDSTGRIWWFSVFEPGTSIKSDIFQNLKDGQVCGWISSRFVKPLEQNAK